MTIKISSKSVDIGCGRYKLPDAIGVDQDYKLASLYPIDKFLCWNLFNLPLPLESKCFGEIFASHILEHFKDPRVIVEEAHRLLFSGGILRVYYPIDNYLDGSEFGHKCLMGENWFEENVSALFSVIKKDVFINKDVPRLGVVEDMPCVYIELRKK